MLPQQRQRLHPHPQAVWWLSSVPLQTYSLMTPYPKFSMPWKSRTDNLDLCWKLPNIQVSTLYLLKNVKTNGNCNSLLKNLQLLNHSYFDYSFVDINKGCNEENVYNQLFVLKSFYFAKKKFFISFPRGIQNLFLINDFMLS